MSKQRPSNVLVVSFPSVFFSPVALLLDNDRHSKPLRLEHWHKFFKRSLVTKRSRVGERFAKLFSMIHPGCPLRAPARGAGTSS